MTADQKYRAEPWDDKWMIVTGDGMRCLPLPIAASQGDAEAIALAMNQAFAAGKRRRSEEINELLRG